MEPLSNIHSDHHASFRISEKFIQPGNIRLSRVERSCKNSIKRQSQIQTGSNISKQLEAAFITGNKRFDASQDRFDQKHTQPGSDRTRTLIQNNDFKPENSVQDKIKQEIRKLQDTGVIT